MIWIARRNSAMRINKVEIQILNVSSGNYTASTISSAVGSGSGIAAGERGALEDGEGVRLIW